MCIVLILIIINPNKLIQIYFYLRAIFKSSAVIPYGSSGGGLNVIGK